jgi:hypothetical protein
LFFLFFFHLLPSPSARTKGYHCQTKQVLGIAQELDKECLVNKVIWDVL